MSLSENEDIVQVVSRQHQWYLSAAAARAYAHFLRTSRLDTCAFKHTLLLNYHADHAVVQALISPEHPAHAQQWGAISQLVTTILAYLQTSPLPDRAVEPADLHQNSLIDIARGLPNFRYESRLHSWIHGITLNVSRRLHRERNAAFRRFVAVSLDTIPEAAEPRDQLQDAVAVHEIWEQMRRCLMAHPDPRLALVFEMKIIQDLRLHDISAQIKLSPARISTLLQLATALLASDPQLREDAALLGFSVTARTGMKKNHDRVA